MQLNYFWNSRTVHYWGPTKAGTKPRIQHISKIYFFPNKNRSPTNSIESKSTRIRRLRKTTQRFLSYLNRFGTVLEHDSSELLLAIDRATDVGGGGAVGHLGAAGAVAPAANNTGKPGVRGS